MTDDISLIQQYLAGEEAAAEELIKRYQRQMYAFFYRMVRDMEDAKDLTQKTFMKAIGGLKGFRGDASFKTWIYQIALNTGLNHLKESRRETVDIDDVVIARQEGILNGLIDQERRQRIRESLHRLPERQRTAVMLRAYDGLSCEEAAQIMGCTEGAVKAHYHLGVKKLRGYMEECGYVSQS
ncbi:MAG TPA: sigma-70 family RNA polymerase sigma factor [Dissulfurispiraceae bacterium]|nr:sigma-70 family RNA polymerase sigma factor [Dissulfurispiraceae bacterium]